MRNNILPLTVTFGKEWIRGKTRADLINSLSLMLERRKTGFIEVVRRLSVRLFAVEDTLHLEIVCRLHFLMFRINAFTFAALPHVKIYPEILHKPKCTLAILCMFPGNPVVVA